MAKEYIIKELGEVLLHTKCEVNHILEAMSFSAKLESIVDKRYLFEYEMLDENRKRYQLSCLYGFEINETWNITDTDYVSRIMADAKVYFIQLGLEHEALFDPDMHIGRYLNRTNEGDGVEDLFRLWDILPGIYYKVYKRIMSFAEYIPPMVDKLIETIHCDYKEAEYWDFTDQKDIQDVLFMYGILHEIITMINEENIIKGTIVTESGERIEASAGVLKPEVSSRELANREKRLRRAAAKKGFHIEKLRKKRNSQNDHDSAYQYYISFGEVDGCGAGIMVRSIKEAEGVVANYGKQI